MTLSYADRLICLVAVTMGLLMAAFEIALWAGTPLVLRLSASFSARQRERLFYLLQLAPLLLAALIAGSVFVPQYIRMETNLETESVGWLCLLLAGAFVLRFGFTVAQGLRIVFRTMRFTAACKRAASPGGLGGRNLPIFVLPGLAHRLVLAGFFRPCILISQDLIEDGGLSEDALDIAFDHERSHAEQFDNWKLLSLQFLPRLGLRLAGGRTWMQLWQSTAEWAADDDAAHGDKTRMFLLAETLVAVARSVSTPRPQVLYTALACEEADLEERVERLLEGDSGLRLPLRRALLFTMLAATLGLAVVAARLTPLLYDLSERLLHLG